MEYPVSFYRALSGMRPAFVASVLKRVFGIQRRIVSCNAGTFWVDPVSELGLALVERGEYEPSMTRTLEKILRPGMTFVDLGANEGFFSVLAARLVGNEGQVLTVEPQARLAPVLSRNFELNAVTNVTLERCAISDKNASAAMYLTPESNSGATSMVQVTKYKLPSQPVDTVTLEALLTRNRIEGVHLIKMDIEGYEYEAILGSPGVFRAQGVRAIALEVHAEAIKSRGLRPLDIIEFLEDCAYIRDEQFKNWVYRPREDFV